MTITIEKQVFLNAIKSVKVATAKAQLQPVLQTINLQTEGSCMTLTATDCASIAKMSIEVNTKDKINICINADRLEAIVSRLDEIFTIELEGATAIFKSGKTRFKCLYIEGSEFPNSEIKLEGEKVTLSASEFISGVNKTCFATQEVSQNIISGIHFDFRPLEYELAATDGNRLCQVVFNNKTGKEGQYTVPKLALVSVAKVVKNDVELYFNKQHIVLKSDNYIYQTLLFNGQYPPYKQLIPQESKITVYLDKQQFLSALDKVSIMANERTNILVMTFKENELELKTECQEGDAKDTLEIDYSDEEFIIGFNYHYLIEGVKAMAGDVISININSNQSAVLLKGDFTYLVMPIQMQKIQG